MDRTLVIAKILLGAWSEKSLVEVLSEQFTCYLDLGFQA